MKFLTKDDARNLYLKNAKVKDIFDAGYLSTMEISNSKLMNDVKVRPNEYLVNDDFENDPMFFSAFYTNGHYKVIRCIYVSPAYRNNGHAREMINLFKAQLPNETETILQVGVEATNDGMFNRLNELYTGLGFKRIPSPVQHTASKKYFDYFWSYKDFEVYQDFRDLKNIGVKFV